MQGKRQQLTAELETPTETGRGSVDCGVCLAALLERLPSLTPLLDFECADPKQVAREVGMVYRLEEDGDADLNEIDFGPEEWFEPSAGLSAVRLALRELQMHPESVAAAVYDPGLTAAAAIQDLKQLETLLMSAQQQEIRFHLRLVETADR